LLALIALVLRLAIPAHAISGSDVTPRGGLADWLATISICHAAADAEPAPAAPEPSGEPAIPMGDCALCPVCHVAAAPVLLPAATWHPIPFSVVAVQFVPLPPSTGPPRPERYAAPPRGPPNSVV
jgi:hypothetical protein